MPIERQKIKITPEEFIYSVSTSAPICLGLVLGGTISVGAGWHKPIAGVQKAGKLAD